MEILMEKVPCPLGRDWEVDTAAWLTPHFRWLLASSRGQLSLRKASGSATSKQAPNRTYGKSQQLKTDFMSVCTKQLWIKSLDMPTLTQHPQPHPCAASCQTIWEAQLFTRPSCNLPTGLTLLTVCSLEAKIFSPGRTYHPKGAWGYSP